MSEITNVTEYDENIHRMEQPTAIAPGTFWRCLQEVRGIYVNNEKHSFVFAADDVYLITRLEFFDGKLHSVVLLDDPSNGTNSGLLTMQLFNENFEWVSDADAKQYRETQIAALMGVVAKIQSEMTEAQVNPAIMAPDINEGIAEWEAEQARRQEQEEDDEEEPTSSNPGNLPAIAASKTGRFDLTAAVTNRIGAQDIAVFTHMAKREGKIAEIKGEWLTEKIKKMQRIMTKLVPFYSEHAALGLARASDAMNLAKEVEKGLRSLRLYTGEGLQIVDVLRGASAPHNEPLTIYQRKLFMDEEFAVWTDVDRLFDFENENKFFLALSENEGLRQQLIPAQRGVLAMAVRRRDVNYDVKSLEEALEAIAKNKMNRELFLLVRDGENWYRIYSDEPSHELSPRLFPTRSEMGDIFNGIDGEKVGFEDLRFSHRASEFDRISLAYKRFLILACGLDHRLQLFGKFYPDEMALNFISLPFQAEYMRFVCDDDGDVMLGDTVGDVSTFIRDNHDQLAAGSRVLVFSRNLLQQEAAPGAFSKNYETNKSTYKRVYDCLVIPEHEAILLTVRRQKDDLVVDLPVVRKNTRRGLIQTHFNVRVSLNKLEGTDLCYLVTETLDSNKLRPFIYNRRSRAHHVEFIYGFKLAIKMLAEPERELAQVGDAVREIAKGTYALHADLANRAAIAAIQSWRHKNVTAEYLPIPNTPGFIDLTDELAAVAWAFKHAIDKVDKAITALGGNLLRLMRGKRGTLIAYYDQPESERDLRIQHWRWVGRRIFTSTGKSAGDGFETVGMPTGRVFGESELFARQGDWVDMPKSPNRRNSSSATLKELTAKLDNVAGAAKFMSSAFTGYRKGISEHGWLLLTSGRNVISSIQYDHYFGFPIGVNTDNGHVIVVEGKLRFILQFYGSDAQRAMVDTWGESATPRKKKSKQAAGEVVRPPYIVVDSQQYWSAGQDAYVDTSYHRSSFDSSNVKYWVDRQFLPPNEVLNNFMVSVIEPKSGGRSSDRAFLDPKSTWFAPECRNADGQFAVDQFFPDYPFSEVNPPKTVEADDSEDDDE